MKLSMQNLALMSAPVLAFVISAQPAQAADAHGFYLGLDAGATASNTLSASGGSFDLGDGLTYAAKAGYDFGMLRLEGEARRLSGDASLGPISVNATGTLLAANAYLEPFAIGKIEPYVMAGYGHLSGELSFGFGSVSRDGNAYQYGLGASYALNDSMTMDAGWRRIEADDLGGVSFESDAFTLGARFKLA